jgi:signal transduction histidine kinase
VGLGLSIVKAIAEAHDGHVEVESEPGSGATFVIELPAPDLEGVS